MNSLSWASLAYFVPAVLMLCFPNRVATLLVRIPSQIRCPSCRYSIGNLKTSKCPECGLPLGPEFQTDSNETPGR